ncbi:hypothetical protein [Myroides marinus]|uniref:PglD-related sugar-binding protein n=1 Tax=Myroides marinus TaxID=703342 RepID=UPI0025757C0A|nr:hypothetical protein [Myroides marinus]
MKKYLIYGKGGHGKVVEDTIYQLDNDNSVEYFDDASNRIHPSNDIFHNLM